MNQLVEKQQKLNPDELKRLQNDNTNLSKQIAHLQNQLKMTQTAMNQQQNKAKNLQETVDKLTADLKAKLLEMTTMQKDLQAKNASLAQLQARINNVMSTSNREKEALR